ncbi:hypothetical protein DFR86_07885 [Acidianus sulfidivorans JP7]|uniref:Uncharacterized protein n=1 Tax=Acidianus sulfidivorans JP7 TaxID=619593 RepID=A0A2U9IN96_9CREN|nr:hypothetical protein [Acidianus sulfidivorans]AWR97477.1 hypothetical protein DFR86_07885 [Acidianus sulfidivorans JP7]
MGIFKKERLYPGQHNIENIVQAFSQYLKDDGWKVQQKVENEKAIIQAQKSGILRDIFAADRALQFTFEQTPEGLKVVAGIGKWAQNLAVTAVEALIYAPLLAVDVPEMLWTEHVESGLMKELDRIVNA